MRSRCTVEVWYGRGMVRSMYGRGMVRSRYGRGMVEVRSWYGRGMVRSRYGTVEVWYGRGMVRSQYGRGMVEVWSRFGRGTVAVRHVIQCSMVAVRSRYSLGMLTTLPVRSWYGILKVRSRLVFSTCFESGTRIILCPRP